MLKIACSFKNLSLFSIRNSNFTFYGNVIVEKSTKNRENRLALTETPSNRLQKMGATKNRREQENRRIGEWSKKCILLFLVIFRFSYF